MELVLYNRHIPSILDTPIYSHFCSYLSNLPVSERDQLEGVVNVPLLVRLVQCEEDELFEVLCFHSQSGRVEKAIEQLHGVNCHEEAEKLLSYVAAQKSSHASLMGVTSAFRSLKGFFS